MAILRYGNTHSNYNEKLHKLQAEIAADLGKHGKNAFAKQNVTGVVLAHESFANPMEGAEANAESMLSNFNSTMKSVAGDLKSRFATAGLGLQAKHKYTKTGVLAREAGDAGYEPENAELNEEEGLTQAQLDSGAVAAVAAHDPVAYAKSATSVADAGNCVNSAQTIEGTLATEAYDNTDLTKHLPFSIVYNTLAARQGPLAEAFFPTQVLTPDSSHVVISVTRSVLMNDFRHKDSGRVVDLKRINLNDAAIDPTILSRHATKMIPVFQTGVNQTEFATGFTPVDVESDGQMVKTAPLAVGREFDFTGLCQAGMAHNAGEGDWSDTIADPVHLQRAYFEVKSKAGKTSVIPFYIQRHRRSMFTKKTMGEEMELGLQFYTEDLYLTATTVDRDGVPAEALDFLRDPAVAGQFLEFSTEIGGTIFLNKGTLRVQPAYGDVKRLKTEANGVVEAINDDVQLNAMKENITSITFVAYDIDANRSNLNRSQRGDLTDTFEERETYACGLGQPVTAITPTTDTRSTTDLLGPITATRLRNDNDAITKLYEVSQNLQEAKISFDKHLPRAGGNIEGIARWVMTPHYERIDVSLLDLLNSMSTQDKQVDVQMAMVNLFRECIYRGYRDSNYEIALRMQTGVEGEKPKVLIGTGSVLANHLIVQGDNRLTGLNFESEIYTTPDRRISELGLDVHDVFITLSRGIPLDPMSFGTFLWMPELATTLQISREGGRTSNEVMVQPRCTHMVQLPWLIHITIRDLGIALVQKTSQDFQMV